ncbi:rhodopsin orphan GPCR [Schistosoma japonicum]|uniref:Rhodopsin orphan GPCR n=1 Tax=Schistosoma japonicum TaxID=6182 RepID=A0A4Z2CPY5_SCHJA|nr:rhodopsin orphan GPCR [Schistosoma japonicum]
MNFISYNNNCTIYTAYNQSEMSYIPPIYIFLVVLSPIALIISCLALTVLTRPQAIRLGSMRINLITLTIFEVLLNSMIFLISLFYTTNFPNDEQNLYKTIVHITCFIIIGGALCSRNWTITLISLARCVAITKPMISRKTYSHLFQPKWMAICTISCLLTGFILSALRLFEMHIDICLNQNNRIMLIPNTEWRIAKDLFFTFQSAIPILIVVLTTVIMLIALFRHKLPNLNHHNITNRMTQRLEVNKTNNQDKIDNNNINTTNTNISISSNYSCHAKHDCTHTRQQQILLEYKLNERRLHNQARATRMITLLTVIFILFEAPVFFCVTFEYKFDRVQFDLVTNALKSLVVLDSCANVIIYLIMSRRFRQESVRLWRYARRHTRQVLNNQSEVTF